MTNDARASWWREKRREKTASRYKSLGEGGKREGEGGPYCRKEGESRILLQSLLAMQNWGKRRGGEKR